MRLAGTGTTCRDRWACCLSSVNDSGSDGLCLAIRCWAWVSIRTFLTECGGKATHNTVFDVVELDELVEIYTGRGVVMRVVVCKVVTTCVGADGEGGRGGGGGGGGDGGFGFGGCGRCGCGGESTINPRPMESKKALAFRL
jgi:hypothetical protein